MAPVRARAASRAGATGRRSLPNRVLRLLLTCPAAVRLKPPIRELWWKLRSRSVRNPLLPPAPRSILFVCLGNICRSPFAAMLAKRRLMEMGRHDVRCTSAGIRASQAERSPDDACAAAARFGLSLEDHRVRMLSPQLMDEHDLVVVMESGQLSALRQAYPRHRDRIVLLARFDTSASTAFERCNIVDPFERGMAAYDVCYGRIERAVAALLATMADQRIAQRVRRESQGAEP